MNVRWFLFLLLFTPTILIALPSEETSVKKIYAHLLIGDAHTACTEAREALKVSPYSKELWIAMINALSRAGQDKEMMSAWKKYLQIIPEGIKNRELLENMAWGIIAQGTQSTLLQIRTMAVLGAFFAQDARGVNILHKTLKDQNSLLRTIAVKLSSELRDAKLRDEVKRLLKEDPVWTVRLQAIRAIGSMHIHEAKDDLVTIITSPNHMAEEKAAAIEAIVHLSDTVERSEIEKMAQSNRAGLRLLACEVVVHCDLSRDLDLIIPLLRDHCAEVRLAALEVVGLLRLKTIEDQPTQVALLPLLDDPEPKVAITAAWTIALNNPEIAQQAFKRWLQNEKREIRIFASAALAACGKYGLPLMINAFHDSQDVYVRMNLSFGLIGQRLEVEKAGQALYDGLTKEKRRWMLEESTTFRTLMPSTHRYQESGEDHPDTVDQLTRLEVLNCLAIIKHPLAQAAMVDFLNHRAWGVSGVAAALLLTEGDEAAIDLVKGLLNHPIAKVRLQAALILALWGREESAIELLEKSYVKANRELKEKILEGIGRIGAQSSIEFLVDKLNESPQSLRLIAACALLQCLNH